MIQHWCKIANGLRRVKHKKTVTSRQIRNLIKKITSEEEGVVEKQHLVDILTKVEDEGGDENQHLVDILTKMEDEGGVMRTSI